MQPRRKTYNKTILPRTSKLALDLRYVASPLHYGRKLWRYILVLPAIFCIDNYEKYISMKINLVLCVSFTLLLSACSTNQSVIYDSADIRQLPCHWFLNDNNDGYLEGRKRARRFSEKVSIYAVAAYNVYEDNPAEIEDIPFPSFEIWTAQKAGKRIEESIGFAANSWIRKKNDKTVELVIAYRGTDSFWKDFFKANLVFAKGIFGRTQFDAALEYAEAVKQSISSTHNIDRVVLTGHSLGGGLAEYVQRILPNSIAISFDASPNQGRLYSLFSKEYASDSIRVYEKGEILSYFRYILSPDLTLNEYPTEEGVKAIWYDFYDSNPMSSHSMHDLAMSLLKVSASTGNLESLNIIKQLELKRDVVSLPGLTCDGGVDSHRVKIRRDILKSI